MVNILIVDDDRFVGEAYRMKLQKLGFTTIITTDGEEALVALKTFKPDLIILDLLMPIKNGFALLQDLKADPELSKIKIVVLTNLAQDSGRQQVIEAGVDKFFIKTNISIQRVADEICALFEKPSH